MVKFRDFLPQPPWKGLPVPGPKRRFRGREEWKEQIDAFGMTMLVDDEDEELYFSDWDSNVELLQKDGLPQEAVGRLDQIFKSEVILYSDGTYSMGDDTLGKMFEVVKPYLSHQLLLAKGNGVWLNRANRREWHY